MSGYLPSSLYANIVHQMTHADRPDRPATVTYTVRNDAAFGANALAEEAHTQFLAFWKALVDSQVTFNQTTAYIGPTPSVIAGLKTDVEVGTSAGNKAPISNAVLIHKRTAFIGRRNRGRLYMPFVLNETTVNEVGEMLPASVTTFTNNVTNWLAALNTSDIPMMVSHSEPTFGSPEAVVQMYCDPVMGTQRRRVRR